MQHWRERQEWKFFSVLPRADPALAATWWLVLVLRGALPAIFGIAMGVLVGAVQRGSDLATPLVFAGSIFVLLQILSPIHQAVSANLHRLPHRPAAHSGVTWNVTRLRPRITTSSTGLPGRRSENMPW